MNNTEGNGTPNSIIFNPNSNQKQSSSIGAKKQSSFIP